MNEVRILLAGHRDVLLREKGDDGLALARALSDSVDALLRAWVDSCSTGKGLAVLALGGYGRGELNPRSDVDVMVLFPDGTEHRAQELTGPLLAFLWDLGHVVGHSVRSLSGCREAMDQDLVSATALLEGRLVTGSRALYRRFVEDVVGPWIATNAESFIERKIEEARARHRFYGNTPLLLAPNVKEGAGGLRDMHVAVWIGFARCGHKDLELFREAGLLTGAGHEELTAAYSFVHRVRNALHESAKARQDVLGPEVREAVAKRLGYLQTAELSATEHLMRSYYRAAQTISRFLERVIRHRFECRVEAARRPLTPGLVVVGNEVFPESEEAAATPASALKALAATLDGGFAPSPDLEAAVRRAALRVDDAARRDPGLAEHFLDLLRSPRASVGLRILDRAGFLGEYLPEYGRISGLAREDPHHTFTVDEHTLRAVENLDAFLAPDHPRREEIRRVARPDLLRLGLLLHDIGKARAGDHVERGAAMVPDVTDRLSLSEEGAGFVYSLVAHHLLLTGLADRMMPADAAAALAEAVPERSLLRALFLTTLADVAAVGKGALSGWREAQLSRLYEDALTRLSPHRNAPLAARVLEEVGRDRGEEVRAHLAGMGSRYALEVEPSRVALHLDLVRRLAKRPVALFHLDRDEFAEVWIGARDGPGLFGRIAGVLTLNDLDIRAAHVYTRADEIALDGFFVTKDGRAPPPEDGYWKEVAEDLADVVAGAVDLEPRIGSHRRRFRPDPAPSLPLRALGAVAYDRVSDRFVAVEVTARDRPGLLFDLAGVIARRGLSIHHAIVATRGPEVTDTFYVATFGGGRPGESVLLGLLEELDGIVGEEG